jgi:hypothetical protein
MVPLFEGEPVRMYGLASGIRLLCVPERVAEPRNWPLRKDWREIALRTLRTILSSDVRRTKPYRSGRHAAVGPRQLSIRVQNEISESRT